MTDEQLEQIKTQTQLGIERDEAEAKQRLAAAAEKRSLLNTIEELQEENRKLKQQQNLQVTNNYLVGRDYIANQTITNATKLSSIWARPLIIST